MARAPTQGSRTQSTRRFNRSSRKYRNAREAWFNSDPRNRLCAECLKHGRTTEATELDHIQPASERPDLFWKESNWQGLCRDCHEKKTQRENTAGRGLGQVLLDQTTKK